MVTMPPCGADPEKRIEERTAAMAEPITIEFTRFSAFYSPLIATFAGGFLQDEGFDVKHRVSPAGKTAIDSLLDGSAHVVQSAPSQGLQSLERGEKPKALHFAQINEKDGFFIAARKPDKNFTWDKLKTGEILVDHGAQPLAMFKYACHRKGLDFKSAKVGDAGMGKNDAAFRAGRGDYVHLQGPGPQQLEHDGVAHVVASLADAIGPCAFSSLAATPAWLKTDAAHKFTRAYRKARAWLLATPAAEVAKKELQFFPGIDEGVLRDTIAVYQKLGNWTPHVEITDAAMAATQDIFLHSGLITKKYDFKDVVAPPPGG
jgi:NitT/TauT family transport system substrate-binding protein